MSNPRPYKYRDDPHANRISDTDDFSLIIQAIENVALSFGGSGKVLLSSLATELKRLLRVRQQQRDTYYAAQTRRWAEHLKETGERHPDDDIPF